MAESTQWSFPRELQPRAADLAFDLKPALDAVVMLRANVPEDAFTASILGTERAGNGVVIRDDGLTLTIGYLITEAESVWLTTNSGATVAAHPLASSVASANRGRSRTRATRSAGPILLKYLSVTAVEE